MMRVDVHQMLLQLVGFGEQLAAAGAAVLRGHREEVSERVRLKLILTRERHRTLVTAVQHLQKIPYKNAVKSTIYYCILLSLLLCYTLKKNNAVASY